MYSRGGITTITIVHRTGTLLVGEASVVVVVAAGCPLLASSWESDVAVASALRWFSAGLLLVGVYLLFALAYYFESPA